MSTPASPRAQQFRHVSYLWDEARAARLTPAEGLVYRSNLLGQDQRITNTGGGNTSAKITQPDPLTGAPTEVLWVKGSGGDLRTSTAANFATLYQSKLLALQGLYAQETGTGVKSPAEDRMVALYNHCTFNLNPRATSIDTPLHSFIPAAHVDHMHPNAVIAIAAASRSQALTEEIFGGDLGWIPWMRPGFELGLEMQRRYLANPKLKGLIMAQHGMISWATTNQGCYDNTLGLIERAAAFIAARDRKEATFGGQRYQTLDEAARRTLLVALLPWLRGQVSKQAKLIATVSSGDAIMTFVNAHDAPRLADLGTSCPDHFLRTKIKPLYVAWDPQHEDLAALTTKIAAGLTAYRAAYAAYYQRCKRPDSPAMRDANPTVILIPGVGMITFGKTKSESRVTAEFYQCAVEVMRGAEAVDRYVALPEQEAFDIEYWALEEAKLKRMPPELEFARDVVVVVGAGNGIGKAVAKRFAKETAHIVCADLDLGQASATADELIAQLGQGIGVGGTGRSSCGPAIALGVDITKRESVRDLLAETILAYGGIDHVVVTAGVFIAPDLHGTITDAQWRLTFEVNVFGSYLVADEARKVWQSQGLPGTLVLTTSVNGVVAKKGSVGYDVSKAAANHLVRELAIELAPTVRVNAIAPATVVAGSTMFPRDRVIASLTKYAIPFSASEETEVLRGKLADFYAQRTLSKSPITPEDQAEGALFLASKRSGKTVGQILNVDGGLHESFQR